MTSTPDLEDPYALERARLAEADGAAGAGVVFACAIGGMRRLRDVQAGA